MTRRVRVCMCVVCAGHGGTTPCKQWYIEITNEATAGGDPGRPEVFFSGNLHGDEDVGPMALIYMAEFLLKNRGPNGNPWVTRLVDTRRIVMVPMTNALGYDQLVREENNVDPNRDFPYNQREAQNAWQQRCCVGSHVSC